ncbi:hypothetical protein CEX98_12730 [Pseudoalteromonas piscicida]|uniref:Orphan protein n=1 Tax=Pseudoalteromonas piscicida TaxID=43662 RepID=A0A2A5JPJ0_PSEO7|nr:hypothetical protein CEX98_12730 [Pseudoalteromonas piscicida]
MNRVYQLLKYSNITIAVSLCAFLLALQVSFFSAESFSLISQVAAHISTIVLAGSVKLAYVVRLVCLYHLGLEVR